MKNQSWLPALVECTDFSKYKEYEDLIYRYFLEDFVDKENTFLGKRLEVTKHPLINEN